VDFDGSFKRALKKLGERHKMTAQKIVNQALLDIAERSFDVTPMADKEKVRGILYARRGKEIGRVRASGKNKGQFKARTEKRQFLAVHLIVNKIRGAGRGLYGNAMRRYSGKVLSSRIGAAGSIKIAFLPVMRSLMPFAKFKFSWSLKAKGIKRWPGSIGWGSATPAKKSTSPTAEFKIHRPSKRSNQDAKILSILKGAVAVAIAWKRKKVIEKAEEMMAQDLRDFNRRA
jgi:hypothetical protein